MVGTEGGRPRIALISLDDARNVRSWSGTLHFSKMALERYVGPVTDLSPYPGPKRLFRYGAGAIRRITGRPVSYLHDPLLATLAARYFSRRLREGEYDYVYAPAASAIVARLETDVPIIYLSDATWRLMEGYYPDYRRMYERWRRAADEAERLSIRRAAHSLFESEWAARSAIDDYGGDPSRVHVVPVGACLMNPPAPHEVLPRAITSPLRLLFVGVDWDRKGGPIAVAALEGLRRRGIAAHLTIVGCRPDPAQLPAEGVTVIPFLNKQNATELEQFERLWKESHLLLLPTRHEAFGLVFCEASAYALPSISTDTGGVSTVVREGANGFLLPPDAGGEEYAGVIAEIISSPERYANLCVSSRTEYEERLNWDVWGRRVRELVG